MGEALSVRVCATCGVQVPDIGYGCNHLQRGGNAERIEVVPARQGSGDRCGVDGCSRPLWDPGSAGTLPFQVNNAGSVQRWHAPRAKGNGGRIHSAKPDGALDLIEQASPGPYLELFARRARFGWDYWGDQSLGTAEMAA